MNATPADGRAAFQAAEPIHAMIYFTPHFLPAYEAVGLHGRRMGYFASRSAALGPVPADVVIATFYNFSPEVVRRAIPDAWALASPADILAARLRAADTSLRQAWGDDGIASPAVTEALDLAAAAAAAAAARPAGRPLFAAHAALPWPDEPHLALWHAQTLLREFRGDGHVALLAAAGVSPVEALITHAASGAVPAAGLRDSRAWSDAEWADGLASARARGWLADGADAGAPELTDAGRAFRSALEDQTDELAMPAYGVLGADGCARLAELTRPLSQAVIDAGLYRPLAGFRPPAG